MENKSRLTLFLSGALLLAMPGWLAGQGRLLTLALMTVGSCLLGIAVFLGGLGNEKTALSLLAITTGSFWLACALWQLSLLLRSGPFAAGTDPFILAVVLWLIILPACALYELGVFVRGILRGDDRRTCLLGLLGLLPQLAAVWVIWGWVQGV